MSRWQSAGLALLAGLGMGLAWSPASAPAPGAISGQESSQFRRAVSDELRRLHRVIDRQERAIRRRCCNAPTPLLAQIAACESGGRPTAVSPGGTYRGKYQFLPSTWHMVGGIGDPAGAPEPEQDYRAWILLTRHGAGHWPVCSR